MEDITKYLIFRDFIFPIIIVGIVSFVMIALTIAESIEDKIEKKKRKKEK